MMRKGPSRGFHESPGAFSDPVLVDSDVCLREGILNAVDLVSRVEKGALELVRSSTSEEVVFIHEFVCRNCLADLIVRAVPGSRSTWLRCPACGKGTLPSDPYERSSRSFVHIPTDPPDDMLVIGPAPEPRPMTPVQVAVPGARGSKTATPPVRGNVAHHVRDEVPFETLGNGAANALGGNASDSGDPGTENGIYESEFDDGFQRGPSLRHVIAGTVLFFSLTLLVISILNQNSSGGSIFGTLAVASLIAVLWPSSPK